MIIIDQLFDNHIYALTLHLIELEGDCGCQEERSRGDGEDEFHGEKPLNDLLS